MLDRKQHPNSFRALSLRKDLRMKYALLYYAVAVCEQIRLLPADAAARLPLSHHKLLLPVKDSTLKCQIAQLAVDHNWPVSQMRCEIHAATSSSTVARTKHKPPPPFVRALAPLRKAVELLAGPVDDVASMQGYTWSASAVAVDALRRQLSLLGARVDGLEAIVAAVDAG